MAFGLLKSPKCIYMSKMSLPLKNIFIQNINDDNKSWAGQSFRGKFQVMARSDQIYGQFSLIYLPK